MPTSSLTTSIFHTILASVVWKIMSGPMSQRKLWFIPTSQSDRAILGEGVRVQEDGGLCLQSLLDVHHTLVLQARVVEVEVAVRGKEGLSNPLHGAHERPLEQWNPIMCNEGLGVCRFPFQPITFTC